MHSSVLNNSVFSSGGNIKDNTHTAATGGHSPYTSTTAAAGAGSNTHPNTAATTTTDRHSRCSSPVN